MSWKQVASLARYAEVNTREKSLSEADARALEDVVEIVLDLVSEANDGINKSELADNTSKYIYGRLVK